MGLFDIFKKKTETIQKGDILESLLKAAMSDELSRLGFYEALLVEPLMVITHKEIDEGGKKTLQEGAMIDIRSLTDGKIPIFSSSQRVFDNGIYKENANILTMKGRDFFELTKGATVVLNPFSNYNKELIPEEIEDLLSGKIFHPISRPITIQKETQVQIGQPAVYPKQMVDCLIELFANEPDVDAAYLGWIFDPSSGEPPHYIFCIDTKGDTADINKKAGTTAQKFFKKREFIDIVNMQAKGLTDYFKKTQPFYKKQHG